MTNSGTDIEFELLRGKLAKIIGKKPTLDGIVFLIGVQKLGKGNKRFSKEEKQDLMHIGICELLTSSGFYEIEGYDEDGWPHYKLINPLPKFDLPEQENLLRLHIKEYFSDLM